MGELRDLENETATVLLNEIKDNISGQGTSGLLDLANAYAIVVGAAPGPKAASPGRVR